MMFVVSANHARSMLSNSTEDIHQRLNSSKLSLVLKISKTVREVSWSHDAVEVTIHIICNTGP